ncbi:DUF3540 domain-containing protein [Kalamiella sp. sgz302252]|uniref:DUF3540 domain-containing protein n=1 Tax=Pantoea sp. sgz302252 TaxID=3341827 RepID=UPI0036D3AEE4
MSNINHQLVQSVMPSAAVAGSVTHRCADGNLVVESAGRSWHCQRAVSCVIAPQVGDKVMVAGIENQMWLLAILARADHQQAELSVPGNLHIHSSGELSLSSESLRIGAAKGDCHIKEMEYSGETVSAWIGLSRIAGEKIESIWRSVTQISRNFLRTTQQTEQVRAGQLDIKAENYARLHAENMVITAKAITKVDSEQIHIG